MSILFSLGAVTRYSLGVIFAQAENTFGKSLYYGFWNTIEFSTTILDSLRMLFTGNVGVQDFMGPVGVSEVVTRTQGFIDFMAIVALISLAIGITNLMPFPPLDGGKIVIILVEMVRRKPMKEQTETTINLIGFALLIGLAIFVTYNDILRIF
ncbi:MAG: site-2 protease family protein [Oscillospiraceae bacterium]|nr:site-2 protease family protein [Oscillospiraceae bacterium]